MDAHAAKNNSELISKHQWSPYNLQNSNKIEISNIFSLANFANIKKATIFAPLLEKNSSIAQLVRAADC